MSLPLLLGFLTYKFCFKSEPITVQKRSVQTHYFKRRLWNSLNGEYVNARYAKAQHKHHAIVPVVQIYQIYAVYIQNANNTQ